MPSQPQPFADMPFPTGGVDTSLGFGEQSPQTTPLGVNVRSFDASEDRQRGGSRPGLAKLVNDKVPV